MTEIKSNLNVVLSNIRKLENSHNRIRESVKLLAVSKTKPIEDIQRAIDCGQKDFGENYLNEAIHKMEYFRDQDCIWHFIGRVQSNKTRIIAENFDWVHTVDRIKIAQRLSIQRPENLSPLNCCIQINIDDEPSKAGVSYEQAEQLISDTSALPRLRIRGLMVIPATRLVYNEQLAIFNKVEELFTILQKKFPLMDTLSMGMSGDLEAAIAKGATIVRVGTAIFGKRPL